MATRTISNTGGNYNAVGTWVEGVVPTSADDIVATATSGQLTVNVASAARSFNFTNYTNTLTLNSLWTVSGVAVQTFVTGMTIAGSNQVLLSGSGATLTTNGLTIPNLAFTGNKVLTSNINVTNFAINGVIAITGGYTMYVSGNATLNGWTTATSTVELTGTGTLTTSSSLRQGPLTINTTGTITIASPGILMGADSILNYTQGNLSGTKKLILTNTNITLNMNGYELDDVLFVISNISITCNLLSELKTKFLVSNVGGISRINLISPTAFLNVTDTCSIIPSVSNTVYYRPYLILGTGVTHSINKLNISGYTTSTNNFGILSGSSSVTKAKLQIGNMTASNIAFTDIQDIEFIGEKVYVYGASSSLTRTINAEIVTSFVPGSTASGGGAWTFVN